MLNMGMTKRKIQTFKTTTINDDQGWFYSNIITQQIISTDTVLPDVTLKDRWSQSILTNVALYFGNRSDSYNRSYTKIQEVIAAIGGFANVFYFGLRILYGYMLRVIRNLLIINQIQFNEDGTHDENNEILKVGRKPNPSINPGEIQRIGFQKKPSINLPKNKEIVSFSEFLCYGCKKRK